MEGERNAEATQCYQSWSLFEEPKAEAQRREHPWLIFVYSILFVTGCSIVSVWVIWTCVNEWPTSLKVYKSNDPWPRPGYTCACDLPGDWTSGSESGTESVALRKCYEREKLETVTVLQYDPSINILGPSTEHIIVTDKSPMLRNFTGAYEVEVDSRVSEVTLRLGDPKGYLDSIHAYKGIESETLDIPFDDILSSRGVLDIPNYFVRWGFEFDCTDCSACSPVHLQEKISSFSGNEDKLWGSCFSYGDLASNCLRDNSYHGKCTLYPTSSIPPMIALKEFLHHFKSFHSITNISGLSASSRTPNALTLESSFIYLVESDVKEIPSISWGFMEVDEQHSMWQVLHGAYPNTSQACGKMSRVHICRLPKLCSCALRRSDQDDILHSHTSCIQQSVNTSSCQDMVASTGMEIDNTFGGNGAKGNQMARICPLPESADCKQVPPNYVTYKPPLNSRVIGIDSKNYIRGWCARIYSAIVRYNNLDDVDGDVHTLPLSEYNPKSGEQSFICYRVKKRSQMRWTVETFGVLFGWIGTLQFVFVLFLPMLVGFIKTVDKDEAISLDAL